MIYYANATTLPVRDAMMAGKLGCINTPASGNITFPGEFDVMLDNGCFSDKWEERTWWNWLIDHHREVRFAVAPDVFDPNGGPCHEETLERWRYWAPKMERCGYTPAFVCQIGSTYENVPEDAKVLFLGGTTEWKEGDEAKLITQTAKQQGRWVHVGRVNSFRRLEMVHQWGADSADGTYLTFGPNTNLPKLLNWLERVNSQPVIDLFSGEIR